MYKKSYLYSLSGKHLFINRIDKFLYSTYSKKRVSTSKFENVAELSTKMLFLVPYKGDPVTFKSDSVTFKSDLVTSNGMRLLLIADTFYCHFKK